MCFYFSKRKTFLFFENQIRVRRALRKSTEKFSVEILKQRVLGKEHQNNDVVMRGIRRYARHLFKNTRQLINHKQGTIPLVFYRNRQIFRKWPVMKKLFEGANAYFGRS